MNKPEIKKQLHNYIDMIEDESQLEMLNEAAEEYATKKTRGYIGFPVFGTIGKIKGINSVSKRRQSNFT